MSPPLLEARAVSNYAGVRALREVSFELRAGELHALVGENGAGKPTLVKILTGAVAADEGEVRVEGEALAHNSPRRARAAGIAAIYQQPALFPELWVAENSALGREPGGPWWRVRWAERERRARELLAAVGARIEPQREAGTLSMPEQQLVEIARAVGASSRVLILDELFQPRLGHETAPAAVPGDQPLVHEARECLPNGRPADIELLAELGFRRNGITRLQHPAADALAEVALQAEVIRDELIGRMQG